VVELGRASVVELDRVSAVPVEGVEEVVAGAVTSSTSVAVAVVLVLGVELLVKGLPGDEEVEELDRVSAVPVEGVEEVVAGWLLVLVVEVLELDRVSAVPVEGVVAEVPVESVSS